jgi:UDP-N-acetylmuramoyl-tripeptide--D-alanyl-D-alanine ligase
LSYKLKDIPKVLFSPIGPQLLRRTLILKLWPILIPAAGLFRRFILRKTLITTVIGSFGKTTTTRVLKAALFREPNPQTNANPDSFVALGLLSTRPNKRRAVFEAGIDRPGKMARFAWMIRPDVVVVTSIGSEHHTSFGNRKTTQDEKAHMVRILPPSGIAVLNGDSPDVLSMKTQTRARAVTFGLGKENDVWAEKIEMDWPQLTRVRICGFGQSRTFIVRFFGWPMIYSLLGAVAAALAQGFLLDDIAAPIETMNPTEGRLQLVKLPNNVYLLRDEFKASIETVDAALDVISDIPAIRRILVVGMVFEPEGEQDKIYQRLGARMAQIADKVVFVGEKTQMNFLVDAAVKTGFSKENLVWTQKVVPDALNALPNPLIPGDVILTKGCSEQRLERIALALLGREVHCSIKECQAPVSLRCDHCSMLGLRRS